jgi:hypothetical protein
MTMPVVVICDVCGQEARDAKTDDYVLVETMRRRDGVVGMFRAGNSDLRKRFDLCPVCYNKFLDLKVKRQHPLMSDSWRAK